MKRFHLHVAVNDLARSVEFYSAVFDAPPAIQHPDYAKWMLENPRINFAISQRGRAAGLDHLGVQVDTDEELQALTARLEAAGETAARQAEAQCCYARSDKTWSVDPSGIAWEAFRTLTDIPLYGEDDSIDAGACCSDSPCGAALSPERGPAGGQAACC
ncbi:MAG: ArsI/CadI family heavy metal resistance metalloenzyme [Parvularculaceae bacterium]